MFNSKGQFESLKLEGPHELPVFYRVDREGTVTLGIPAAGHFGAVVGFNKEEAMFEQGVSGKFEPIHGIEGEFELTAGAYGLTAEQAKEAVESPGFFTAPERDAGMRWEQLPPARREAYAKMHWSKDEWNAGAR